MNKRHKSIRHKSLQLAAHERSLLVCKYQERRIPIEQYESRSADLASLVDEWNQLTSRTDSGGELIHYMRTQRKRGKWVRFDGAHLPPPPAAEFSAEETETLVAIYAEDVAAMGVGSDVIAYEDDLKELIVKEFAARTGRIVSADHLVAKLTLLRKLGQLPKAADVTPAEKDPDIGFGDISKAV